MFPESTLSWGTLNPIPVFLLFNTVWLLVLNCSSGEWLQQRVAGAGSTHYLLSPCPMEELDAVDVVSVALAVASLGSLGFEVLVFESIPVATAPGPGKSLKKRSLYFFPR